MLSEKKFSKKSPSKIDISSVLEQIGLLSRGKVSICSQGEALGGIAERPLTDRNTYNIRRSRTSKMFGCCLRRRVVGVWGHSPRKYGCRAESPAGCGQSPRFCLVNKRKLPPCVVNFLLIHYAEISLSRSGRIFSENLHPTLDNIRRFSRSEDKGKPGILTCPNGQLQIPNPPERKEKKKI